MDIGQQEQFIFRRAQDLAEAGLLIDDIVAALVKEGFLNAREALDSDIIHADLLALHGRRNN